MAAASETQPLASPVEEIENASGSINLIEKDPTTPTILQKRLYLGVAIATNTILGCAPFFVRYLQVESGMDALVIASLASSAPVVIIGFLKIRHSSIRSLLEVKWIWMLVFIAPIFPICLTYSLKFTLSIYYQLINLTAPLFTALLYRLILKRKFVPYTIPVICIGAVGSFLALSGDLFDSSADVGSLTADDLIGISLGFSATIGTALYFVFLQTIDLTVPQEVVFWFVALCQITVIVPVSVAIDDWSIMTRLTVPDYIVLSIYVFIVFTITPVFQLQAIRVISAPGYAAIVPWRIIPALFLGMSPLLDEKLSITNFIGVAVVFLSTSFYVFTRFKHLSNQKELDMESK